MLKLDNNLLNELGLGVLPEEQKRSILQHIYDTLELRVGTRLANQMSDQQLQEFEKFIDAGGENNQAQALQWLETNLPNYKQVVNDVFEELKTEIRQMAPQIISSTSSAPGQAQPQVAPQAPAGEQSQQSQQPYQPAYPQNDMYNGQQPQAQPQFPQQQQPNPGYAQPNQADQFPPQQPQQPQQHPGQPNVQAPQYPQQPYGNQDPGQGYQQPQPPTE